MAEREKCEDRITPNQELVSYSGHVTCFRSRSEVPASTMPATDGERLIPGLPNEVVVNFILTKLPWSTLYKVSSLNHAWQDVVRTGEVYDARVLAGSLENLIVMSHAYPNPDDRIFQGVTLYDPARDSWHLLPPLPRVRGGIISKYECTVVMGKVYVIGGLNIDGAAASNKAVLMLDLGACRGVWNQCAKMTHSRLHFACHVKDNKIFVFGGVDELDHMLDEAHVYDPAEDSWSQLASMGYRRSSHEVICLNDRLYLCGGSFWNDAPGSGASKDHRAIFSRQVWNKKRPQDADFMEFYDSSKDSWQTVENFTKGRTPGSYFVVDECLYHLTHKAVEVYDKQSKTWHPFRLQSWSHTGASEVAAAEVVNGVIFALVHERRDSALTRDYWSLARYNAAIPVQAIPIQATWSGSPSSSLSWKRMYCPHDFNWSSCSIQPIQL